ncbi:hypothetical protein Goari_015989 [Gossypium aridum]|uniref:Uncharacterized protein n=1 Tax=Gossypium aridum TaxID=34290 RepID=A0A7J8WH59_GOSAI|nr:hypothetical protein [Gossypium aridum]
MLHQKGHNFSQSSQVDHGEALQLQLHHGCTTSYGNHWRNLRLIFAIEIFSSSRLNSIITVRKDEVQRLLDGCREEVLRAKVTNENEAREFREVITGAFRNVGTANGADFLPVLN